MSFPYQVQLTNFSSREFESLKCRLALILPNTLENLNRTYILQKESRLPLSNPLHYNEVKLT